MSKTYNLPVMLEARTPKHLVEWGGTIVSQIVILGSSPRMTKKKSVIPAQAGIQKSPVPSL